MSSSEYIASFFLVIIGFAVSELLKGSARLLRERHHIKLYWPYLLVIPLLFEVLIFWFLWIFTIVQNAPSEGWSVVEIMMISLQVTPWAFVSYLIFPTRIKEGFQLKDFYFENGKFVTLIVTIINVIVVVDMIRTERYQGITAIAVSLVLNVIVLLNFKRFHLIWLILSILLVNYFIFFGKPITIM